MFGDVTVHGVEGFFADSFNVLELVFAQGLFEITQAADLVFST